MIKALYPVAVASLLLGGCSYPAQAPARPAPSVSPSPGTPGAFCATSRLGKRFAKDGITYVCRGPKPYRWRPAQKAR